MGTIISLNAIREQRQAEQEEVSAYHALILSMDKLELLEEMVRFQEERARIGHLTLGMMMRGQHLFKALEDSSETQELKLLTGSYRRHLEHELAAYRKRGIAAYEETQFADLADCE
jgi:hypothetical protein